MFEIKVIDIDLKVKLKAILKYFGIPRHPASLPGLICFATSAIQGYRMQDASSGEIVRELIVIMAFLGMGLVFMIAASRLESAKERSNEQTEDRNGVLLHSDRPIDRDMGLDKSCRSDQR